MDCTSEDTAILSLFPREEWHSINMSQARYLKRKYDVMMKFQKDGSFEYFKNECKKRDLESCGVFKGVSMKTAYNRLVTGCHNNEIKRSRINKIMYDLDGPFSKALLSNKLLTSGRLEKDINFYVDWCNCEIRYHYLIPGNGIDYYTNTISHSTRLIDTPGMKDEDKASVRRLSVSMNLELFKI